MSSRRRRRRRKEEEGVGTLPKEQTKTCSECKHPLLFAQLKADFIIIEMLRRILKIPLASERK
jgi:hypothetical protein